MYRCVICGKKPVSGNSVSHSHRATKRRFYPNLQHLKIFLNGRVVRDYVCTACIRSGRVVRPPVKNHPAS